MSLKTTALIVTAALATSAFAGEAQADSSHALDACVKSFIADYLPDRVVRVVDKDRSVPSPLETFYGRKYTIALAAYGIDSGTLIAQARCVANNRGHVIVLDNPPAAEYVSRADFAVTMR